MADGDSETQRNTDGVLNRLFPGAATRAIASSAISQDEQFSGSRISLRALLNPPLRDGIDSKGWGVVAGSQKHRAPVGLRVVDAVGCHQRLGLGTKVVILDKKGLAIPLGSGVPEVTNGCVAKTGCLLGWFQMANLRQRPLIFKWRHFEPHIILCAIRWYLRLDYASYCTPSSTSLRQPIEGRS